MAFSKSWGYAVRALVELAKTYDSDKKWQAGELAEAAGLPVAFLPKVLQQLSASGLVKSTRGRGGGVALAKSPAEICLLDVASAIEEASEFLIEKSGFEDAPKSLREKLYKRWQPVSTCTVEFLSESTIEDLTTL